jgi:hypothetical protein
VAQLGKNVNIARYGTLCYPSRMENEPRGNRVPFMMSDSELKQLDDWMFDHRVRGRSEAIRRLIQLGMRHAPPTPGARKVPTRKRPARLAMARGDVVVAALTDQ